MFNIVIADFLFCQIKNQNLTNKNIDLVPDRQQENQHPKQFDKNR